MVSSTLSVAGAELAYDLTGRGPLLVLIPGANGEGSIFKFIAGYLASRYTVCTYARRRYAPSKLQGPPPQCSDPSSLITDANDAAALISHLSPLTPALVFGTSSGAIVALTLLQMFPEKVKRMIAHEPPLTRLLGPDGEEELGRYDEIKRVYEAKGWQEAVSMFAGQLAGKGSPEGRIAETMGRAENETAVKSFLEGELTVYKRAQVDLNKLSKAAEIYSRGGKLILAYGEETEPVFFRNVVERLAENLKTGCVGMPGGHLGNVSSPKAFASKIMDLLKEQRERL